MSCCVRSEQLPRFKPHDRKLQFQNHGTLPIRYDATKLQRGGALLDNTAVGLPSSLELGKSDKNAKYVNHENRCVYLEKKIIYKNVRIMIV